LVSVTLSLSVEAQEPSLDTVLQRAAGYVDQLSRQLSGIVAEESYVQEVKNLSSRNAPPTVITRRELTSDFLLVKPSGSDRFVEFRDVFEVDGRPVRDRQDRLTKLFLTPSPDTDHAREIVEESARYNIGDITRNVNTPMLPLMFLQKAYQPRFRFKRTGTQSPSLSNLTLAGRGGSAVFRASTEVWVVEFRERKDHTVIHTPQGEDFPATGRFWIEPDSGAVLMSELLMEMGDTDAVINVSYQSEPLIGLRVPVEMHERYRGGGNRVEGVATYGRFRQFQVKTDEVIDKPPVKPPGSP
jgi:hypothetical protein